MFGSGDHVDKKCFLICVTEYYKCLSRSKLIKRIYDKNRNGLGLRCLTPLSTIFHLYRGRENRNIGLNFLLNGSTKILECYHGSKIEPSNTIDCGLLKCNNFK